MFYEDKQPLKEKPPMKRRRLALFAIVGLELLNSTRALAAPYQIEVGDVLEFSVVSLPNLKQRIAVDINGEADFPLLQNVQAAGVPLNELRIKVRDLISAKPFRQRESDGRETLLTIDPDEITINIVEYRPIYITGDVGHPGEQPFRPGINVRQAIALSGGYDSAQTKLGDKQFQLADLRSQYQVLSTNLFEKILTINRVQAELDSRSTFEQALIVSSPIEAAIQRSIVQREKSELTSRMKDYLNEKAFLARSVSEADKFLSVLGEQQVNEKQGADLDAQDFDRLNTLYSKGAIPITRVIDARRSLLLSSTRQLQTSVQVSESQARRDSLIHDSDKLDDQREARLLQELQTANFAEVELSAQLRGVAMKLSLLLGARGQDGFEVSSQVQLFRQSEPVVIATDDMLLQPGDVLKARLINDAFAIPAPQQ